MVRSPHVENLDRRQRAAVDPGLETEALQRVHALRAGCRAAHQQHRTMVKRALLGYGARVVPRVSHQPATIAEALFPRPWAALDQERAADRDERTLRVHRGREPDPVDVPAGALERLLRERDQLGLVGERGPLRAEQRLALQVGSMLFSARLIKLLTAWPTTCRSSFVISASSTRA